MMARAGQNLGRGRMWPEQIHDMVLWKDTRRTAVGSAQGVVQLLGFALDTEKMHITPPTTHSREPGITSHWCGQLARSNLLMNRAQKDINARTTARSTLK